MWKTSCIPSVSFAIAITALAPTGALAQLPLPLGGPPPIGAGGPPPAFGPHGLPAAPGLGGQAIHPSAGPAQRADLGGPHGMPSRSRPAGIAAGSRGVGISGQAVQSRSAAFGYGRAERTTYAHDGWRHGYARAYGAYVYGAISSSYADDGCYYAYRRYRRVLVCD
jgi:hypothetical protein